MPALPRRIAGRIATTAALTAGALALCAATGCTRTDYRLAADRDVRQMIGEKSADPRWGLPGFTLRTDPRSRYYDPTNPDRPPMPPDDPTAHQYMHSVDGMRGWPHWHRNGDLRTIELSHWRERLGEYVPLDEQGRVVLNVESAMQLGHLHARDFRQQLETLYLSALDVSTERFRLSTQFFANTGPNFTTLGRARAGGDASTLRVDSGSSLRRRFATGGELLVGFANSFVWQFAGDDTNNTNSLINFTLVQPLLKSGGRVIALEQLTIVERSLLANLRAFQRYRQGFYTFVTIGDRGVGSLQRRGGFFGGTGLTGFTGTGAGGIGGVGGGTFGIGGGAGGAGGGGAGGGTGFAGGGAGNVGGYLGLLQQLQQIRNVEENLAEQLRVLGLLEANLDAGLIDIGQVDQFRQNIETQRANLLQARNALQTSIDNFNVNTLGLPPDLDIALDDTLIRQFQFIAPATHDANNAIADLIAKVGDLPDQPPAQALLALRAALHGLTERAAGLFATAEADLAQMEEAVEIRERGLSSEERRLFAADRRRLRESLDELQERDAARNAALAEFDLLDPAAAPGLFADELVGFAADLGRWVQELSLVQARARLERLYVEPVELEWPQALAIARANRLDWMNNRAALVDTWRLIAFNANALESSLDVTFSGDLGTVGDNPVRFRSTNGSLRAGLRFDAPFTRLLERNNYRQVLIDYQRDRRSLMAFEDGVNQSMRLALRTLEQLRVNLEIQRRAIVIALRRVDQTREVLNEPPPPVQPGQPAAQLGPTAALDALTALNDLRATQNNLMSVWLNYYAERMALMRDLGLMELDHHGIWIDRPYDFNAVPQDYECWTPPALPERWLRDAGLTPDSLDAAADESAEEVQPALELPDPNAPPTLPELSDEPPADLEALPPGTDDAPPAAPLLPGPPLPEAAPPPDGPPRPRRGDDLPDPFEQGRRPPREIQRTSWLRPLGFLREK